MKLSNEYYKVIADVDELEWFYNHCVHKPKMNEAYAFCLSFRNKRLTDEEKEALDMPRSEMLDPQVVFCHQDGSFSFRDFLSGLAKYEVRKDALTTRNGSYYLEKSMVCYFHVNPCDELKVISELKDYINTHEQELIDSAIRDLDRANEIANITVDMNAMLGADNVSGEELNALKGRVKALGAKSKESGTSQSLYKMCKSLSKMKRLQFDNVGTKYWVDFDMDIKKDFRGEAPEKALLEDWHNYCLEKLGKGMFVEVKTGGGMHTLVNKSVIHFDPNKFINEFLEKNINGYGCAKEFIDELVYNTNGLVPCPGTYQYGNCVRILNKEDFN